MTSDRPAQPTEIPRTPQAPGATSKPPPFKLGAPPASAAAEAPSTLLFNDVSDDGLVCDPNDPDCEIV